jgi:ferritin-like protein
MTTTDALQDALAAEHAAVYVFGVLGAQTSEFEQRTLFDSLLTAYQQHRSARDELVARIRKLGVQPVAAAPAYELPNGVSTPAQVVRAALVTERRATQTYGTLVAQTVGDDRAWAIDALDESAVRQLRFRGRPENFPGTQGLA